MNGLVYLKNDEVVCSSRDVAERFGKRHDNVIQAIRSLLKNKDVTMMFGKAAYKDAKGEVRPMYLINRDGFSLLVMGFTGKDALEWKLKYIKAFNSMEAIIQEKSTAAWIESRQAGKLTRKAETDVIQELVQYAQKQGSTHADKLYMTYSKLANKMAGVESREIASAAQLNNLSLMENIILCVIRECMIRNLHYKEIYQECKKRLELVKNLAYLDVSA